jgi:nucleoside-diphosphate-sugar epimerase
MKQMQILMTGSSGFIGFHTARVLLARGDTNIGRVDSEIIFLKIL